MCITGGAGQISYSLIWMALRGTVFGRCQRLDLRLLEIPPVMKALHGVCMEIEDSASPLLAKLTATSDPDVAFAGCQAALLVGARPRSQGMLRADLLRANAAIFDVQGRAIDKGAAPDCRILVVGNPANTNAMILASVLERLPRRNVTAITRLDQNRAVSQLAAKLGVPAAQIHNVVIWGNHSITQVPDVSSAFVSDFPVPGVCTPVRRAVNDEAWFAETFMPAVQRRGAAVLEARGLSSVASAANAISDHMHTWLYGTPKGAMTSMGVYSLGEYGIPEGLVFSMPCTCEWPGIMNIVTGLRFSPAMQPLIDATTAELETERTEARSLFDKSEPSAKA